MDLGVPVGWASLSSCRMRGGGDTMLLSPEEAFVRSLRTPAGGLPAEKMSIEHTARVEWLRTSAVVTSVLTRKQVGSGGRHSARLTPSNPSSPYTAANRRVVCITRARWPVSLRPASVGRQCMCGAGELPRSPSLAQARSLVPVVPGHRRRAAPSLRGTRAGSTLGCLMECGRNPRWCLVGEVV